MSQTLPEAAFCGTLPLMRFHLVSLFPEFFDSPLQTALMGRAREQGLVSFSFHDPRSFSQNKHRHVDDRPYGGGPGMVMQGEPVAAALRSIEQPGRILLLSPGGRPFTQAWARELAKESDITLVCGRYEGLDARLGQLFPLEPVSVGEAVLNGGETAALAVLEAVSRLVPGFMGKEESGEEESFSHGLLEYPHYTRPEQLEGLAVPPVLLGGDHAAIARWRRNEALRTTLAVRPDLLATAPLDANDARQLAQIPRKSVACNLSFCLLHYPVMLDAKKSGTASLTNLDIHDISRISRSYAMGSFYVATPLEDQRHLLEDILRHWTKGVGSKNKPDRAQALDRVCPVPTLGAAIDHLARTSGQDVKVVASSAVWPEGKPSPIPVTPATVREWCREGPVLLCLGTAQGLAPEVLACCHAQIRPLRFLGYNHLSVRSAAAILADRILGDFF